MMENNNKFTYTYSAVKNDEIASIRRRYGIDDTSADDQETILAELRKLDRATVRPGTIAGLTIGICGTLIMGTGMSLAMEWSDTMFALGIVVGVIGIAILAAAYPVYRKITKKKIAENAPRIKELSDRLVQ